MFADTDEEEQFSEEGAPKDHGDAPQLAEQLYARDADPPSG